MFKNLMDGVSLSSLMLRAPDDEAGAAAKTALREKLAKGNVTPAAAEVVEVVPEVEEEQEEEQEEDADPETDPEADPVDPPAEETAEQKAAREAQEKVTAKAKRKDDRMQARIDRAVAEKRAADDEIAKLKAQLAANPDTKLTPEEVESRAEAIAAKKLADKELETVQAKFEADCETLKVAAIKVDKDFFAKVTDMATDLGPIPTFMINVLSDLDNGGEVLAFIANDDEVAERIYSHQKNAARMTKAIVDISNKLTEAKKPPRRQISKVPDPGKPVNGSRVVSNVITEADTKNMDQYVAKRQKQMLENRRLKGF